MSDLMRLVKNVLVMALALAVLCATIEPALAASSSLPPGAHLGIGMASSRFGGFQNPFAGGFGSMYGPWEDMDDMDLGGMGMMGPYGFMNPWMMRSMGMGFDTGGM